MKLKTFYFFIVALLALFLSSCGRYSDGTPVNGGGAWIIPALLIGGALVFIFFGYRSWTSGTIEGRDTLHPTYQGNERVKFYKVWQFLFALGLILAAIIYFVVQNAGK